MKREAKTDIGLTDNMIAAASRASALASLEFAPDDRGLPYCRDIAEALRRIIRVRGVAPRALLQTWLRETLQTLGCDPAAVSERVDFVLEEMTRAGDVVPLTSGGVEALAARQTRLVVVSSSMAALLGVEPEEHDEDAHGDRDPNACVRLVPLRTRALTLTDELGLPSFRGALSKMGLALSSLTTLSDYQRLLEHEIIRRSESADSDAVEICGTLRGDGTFAVGYRKITGSRQPCLLRALGDGELHALPLPDGDAMGWLALASQGFRGDQFQWRHRGVPPPRQLLSALALCGRLTGELSWRLIDGASDQLSAWLGAEPAEEGDLVDVVEPDHRQQEVIEAASHARLVVEAGPGSGKTWVACQRVAHLIATGVPPSRIVMISFTRTAISELRSRIGSFLPDPAAVSELALWTLDSLAWRLRTGFGGSEDGIPAAGYEAGIEDAVAMFTADPAALVGFIRRIEHLVLDEAQDFVGIRRRLVLQLLSAMAAGSGVTIFTDSAQAIYGWEEPGDETSSVSQALLELKGFHEISLDEDHRTRTPRLKFLFAAARRLLLREEDLSPEEQYLQVRELIERNADGVLPAIREQDFSSPSTLVLFRSRGALMSAATDLWSVGADFGLRMSGRRAALQPWLARLLSGAEGQELSKAEHDLIWNEIWPQPLGIDQERAWQALTRITGAGKVVDLGRLRIRIAASVPPLELALPEYGGRGAVLSTIHGAKGREADHVRLMLPRIPGGLSRTRWDEEARVLFVGATRARRSLWIGSAENRLSNGGNVGRLWHEVNFRTGRNARVEFGADGDVDEVAQVSNRFWSSSDDVAATQSLLWSMTGKRVPVIAELIDGMRHLALRQAEADGPVLGFLSSRVTDHLWRIGEQIHGARTAPPRRIRGLWMVGIRTAVATPEAAASGELLSPYDRSLLWLVPVIAGIAPVFFNARATDAP